MKIMIFASYGISIPKMIMKEMSRLGKDFPASRYGEIIDYIEHNAVSITSDKLNDLLLKNNPNKIYKVTDKSSYNSDTYYGICDNNIIGRVVVKDIDTTKKYIIRQYDGSESIIELPTYRCIDTTINLYEEIND